MKARDLMSSPVFTVKADDPLTEAARILTEHSVNSVPVVDADGAVIGIVGKDDLFLKEKQVRLMQNGIPTLFGEIVNPQELLEKYRAAALSVSMADVMNTEVICVNADDTIGDVATIMLQNHIDMTPVLENGRLVGVLSRRDMIQFILKDR